MVTASFYVNEKLCVKANSLLKPCFKMMQCYFTIIFLSRIESRIVCLTTIAWLILFMVNYCALWILC